MLLSCLCISSGAFSSEVGWFNTPPNLRLSEADKLTTSLPAIYPPAENNKYYSLFLKVNVAWFFGAVSFCFVFLFSFFLFCHCHCDRG